MTEIRSLLGLMWDELNECWIDTREESQNMTDKMTQPLIEVFVEESCERWSEFFLSDGTVLRAKILPTQFFRAEGKFDERGMPQYIMGPTTIMWIIRETPVELKQTRN